MIIQRDSQKVLPFILAAVVIVVLTGFGLSMPTLLVDVTGHLLAGRPDDVEGWCYYGGLLEKTGHDGEAVEAYKTALKLNPNYTDCWNRLGKLLERMGDLRGAGEAYGFAAE